MAIQYEIIEVPEERRAEYGHYKISTRRYSYNMTAKDNKEIFAYQWQPEGTIKYPHLHTMYQGRKRHFPTGRISMEQVIKLVIYEYGVRTMKDRREDWESVLDENQKKFEKWRTWHAMPPD